MSRFQCIACVLLLLLIGGRAPLGAELSAGVAIEDITPPVPYRMSGYFSERLSTGVKDRLQAKAIVFQQGDESAAIVFCDLIGISVDVSTKARQLASEATGIPAAQIAVVATHSHTGPLYADALRDHLHERSIVRTGSDPYETVDYPARLVDQVVAAIGEAKKNLSPVQLSAGNIAEARLSFNRRFHMRDGSVRFNPGQLNADIVRAAGPIDPQVGVISLSRIQAPEPFAAVVCFALHLDTVGGTEYSADYPKALEGDLRKLFGSKFDLLFGIGTCGDINHIDVTTREVRSAEQIGHALAETIGPALEHGTLAPIDTPALSMRSVKVEVPLQTYSGADLADARKNMELIGSRELPFLDQVKAYRIMSLASRQSDHLALEIQALRLDGNTAIAFLPGEVFVDLGMQIKAASPFETTLVIELANDSPGYLPTRRAFVEGSYEIENSRVQPGGGEKLVDAATRLLEELK